MLVKLRTLQLAINLVRLNFQSTISPSSAFYCAVDFMTIKDSCIENALLLNCSNILYTLNVCLRIPASQFHPVKWMSASTTSTCTRAYAW